MIPETELAEQLGTEDKGALNWEMDLSHKTKHATTRRTTQTQWYTSGYVKTRKNKPGGKHRQHAHEQARKWKEKQKKSEESRTCNKTK